MIDFVYDDAVSDFLTSLFGSGQTSSPCYWQFDRFIYASFLGGKIMQRTSSKKWMKFIVIVPCVVALSGVGVTPAKPAPTKTILSRSLPRLDGANLKVTAVEVMYGPGDSSLPHSHPCPVIGYVLEGALRTRVKGETEAVYNVGESFYEAPNGIHAVSANASRSEPARFLALFVCDHDTPLSVAPPAIH